MGTVQYTEDHGPIVPWYRGNYSLGINAANSTNLKYNRPNVPQSLAHDDLLGSGTGWFYPSNTDRWHYSATGMYTTRDFVSTGGQLSQTEGSYYQTNTHYNKKLGGYGKMYGKSMYHMVKGDWRWRGDVVDTRFEPWGGLSALNDLNAPQPEGTVYNSNLRIVPIRTSYNFDQDGHEFYSDIAQHVAYTDTPANRAMWSAAGRPLKGSNRWGLPFRIYPTGNAYSYQQASGGYPYVGQILRRDAYNPVTNTTTLQPFFLGDNATYFLGESFNSIRVVADYVYPLCYGLYELGPSMVNGWYEFGANDRRDYPRQPGGANSPFWNLLPGGADGSKGFDYIANGIKGFAIFALKGAQPIDEFSPQSGPNYGEPVVDMTPTGMDNLWMNKSPLISYVQFDQPWHAEDTERYYPGTFDNLPDYAAWGTMPLAIKFDSYDGLVKLVVTE